MSETTIYAYAELNDGTTYSGVRVPLASKLQWEKTAKAQRWEPEANPFTFGAFLAWHVGKATGRHTLTWEQFRDTAIDAGIEDEADAEDPTPPPATDGSPAAGTE